MFLENRCAFYDRQIILLNIVILRSSYAQMSKPSIIGILGKLDKLNKSNLLRYITDGSKSKITKFCRILTPWFGTLAVG